MATKGTAIRLSTTGKAEVKSDFGEIRQAGESAFKGIGDSARGMTANSQREFDQLSRGYDKAVAEMEAADRRRARVADKFGAMLPQTPVQAQIGATVGTGYGAYSGSARESAGVLRELLAVQDAEQAKAAAILAIINPLAAAQERYNADLGAATALKRQGLITDEQLIQYEGLLKQRLDATTVANGNAARSFGAHRAGMQQLGFQASDFFVQISGGTSAIRALSQQAPQAVQAIAMMGGGAAGAEGKFAKFASFLGGPWGAAILVGVSIAGLFATKLLEGGKAAEDELGKLKKNAQETEAARLAKEKFATTEEGVTKAIRDQKEALDKQIDGLKSEAERSRDAAKANLEHEISIRKVAKAQLEASIASNAAYQGSLASTDPRFASQFKVSDAAIADLKNRLAQQDSAIATATQNLLVTQSQFSIEQGKRLADPVEVIKQKYEGPSGLIEQARKRAVAEGKVGDALERQIKLLTEQQAREEKDARPSSSNGSLERAMFGMPVSGGRITGQFGEGRPGHSHAGLDIAVPVGSAVRAPAGGVVIEAGTLGGYGNVVFIDHGGGTITRLAHLSKIDVAKGQVLDQGALIGLSGGAKGAAGSGDSTGPHLHYEVRVGGKAVDPRKGPFATDSMGAASKAEKLEQEADRAKDQAIRRQRDFDSASLDLDAQILQAKRGQLTDIGAIAAFEAQQVIAETAKYDIAVEAKVQLGDLTREEADELETKRAIVTNLKTTAIATKAEADQLVAAGKLDDDLLDHKTEVLKAQESLVKTAGDRRAIELQILDFEKQPAKAHYDQVIALGKLGQATDDQVKAAQDGLNNLDTLYGAKRTDTLKQTAGPLEAYNDNLDQSKQQIYERAQSFATDELDYFRKGLDDAITKKLGIKDPFISQLIDLFIEQWLIKPITAAITKGMSATDSGGGGIGAFVSGVSSSIGHFLGGNAVGTENFSGGYTWLAENGPELVKLPRGSKVTPAAETRRMLAGANDNRPIVIQQFDYSNAVMTEDLMREMDKRSRSNAEEVTKNGISNLIDGNQRSYGRLLNAGR